MKEIPFLYVVPYRYKADQNKVAKQKQKILNFPRSNTFFRTTSCKKIIPDRAPNLVPGQLLVAPKNWRNQSEI
jgi:hypothetical protein